MEMLQIEVKKLTKIVGNVRRGMFSRHDELEQKFDALREENERLRASNQELKELIQEGLLLVPSAAEGGVSVLTSSPVLRSMSNPVSFLMTSSQASSAGLSLPKK